MDAVEVYWVVTTVRKGKCDPRIKFDAQNVTARPAGALLEKGYPMMATCNEAGKLKGVVCHEYGKRGIKGIDESKLDSGLLVAMGRNGHAPTLVPGDLEPLYYEGLGNYRLRRETVVEMVEVTLHNIAIIKPMDA